MVDDHREAQSRYDSNFATISKKMQARVVYSQFDVEKNSRKYSISKS